MIKGVRHSSEPGNLEKDLRRLLWEHKALEYSSDWFRDNYVLTIATLIHAVSDVEAREYLCKGAAVVIFNRGPALQSPSCADASSFVAPTFLTTGSQWTWQLVTLRPNTAIK